MIPLRDTIPSKTHPVVTIGLMAVNGIAFLYELSLGSRVNDFLLTFGLVPVRYFHFSEMGTGYISRYMPFFTSIFLHGGWFHIIGNMWYLWIFGDNVEERMGHIRYFIFYILCGLAAGFAHVFTNTGSGIPTIGASGAVAGVMGAYLILYPGARVWTLIPIFFFVQFVELPAVVFLGLWILMQFLIGTFSKTLGPVRGGVAWWAHVGGFVAGVILVFVFRKRRKRLARRYPDEYWPW